MSPIGPVGRTAAPSHSFPPAHKFTPSYRLLMSIACARRPGPRVRSSKRVVPRRRCMKRMPSSGSTARTKTPAPVPFIFTRDVHHEAGTIGEIHVGVAMRKKQRAPARREAAKRVRCRVADRIGFGLDDASGEAYARQVVNERLADQIPGKFERVDGEFRRGANVECAGERLACSLRIAISPPVSRCPAERRILRSAWDG